MDVLIFPWMIIPTICFSFQASLYLYKSVSEYTGEYFSPNFIADIVCECDRIKIEFAY